MSDNVLAILIIVVICAHIVAIAGTLAAFVVATRAVVRSL